MTPSGQSKNVTLKSSLLTQFIYALIDSIGRMQFGHPCYIVFLAKNPHHPANTIIIGSTNSYTSFSINIFFIYVILPMSANLEVLDYATLHKNK